MSATLPAASATAKAKDRTSAQLPNTRPPGEQNADQQKQERRKKVKADVESEARKTQAISVLYDVVDHLSEIPSVESRARIAASALGLLWKRDEPRARSSFTRILDRFLTEYSLESTANEQKEGLSAAIRILASSLARYDPTQAESALARLGRLADERLDRSANKLSLNDKLSIAQSSLDSDVSQSAMIAARVLEGGVPWGLPNYLYDLENRNEASANALFRIALTKLTNNPLYNPVHATILSSYAFRERSLVIQVASPGNALPFEFGSLSNNLTPSSKPFNLELAQEFFGAAYLFLGERGVVLQQQATPKAEYVMQCYFLASKLNAYALGLNLDQNRQWEQLRSKYEPIALRAGLTGKDLGDLATIAQRLVAEGSVFQFDNGAADFEKARASKVAREKTALLVRGIHALLEGEQFADAEQRISEIQDESVVGLVTDYLHFCAGKAAVRKGRWNDVSYHSNKISDSGLRMNVLLEGIKASLKNRKRDIAWAYLQTAAATAQRIADKSMRAKALVAIAGLVPYFDSAWSSQPINDAVKAINQADDYEGLGYSVTIELPTFKLFIPLADSDLTSCFERSARTDWLVAINAAGDITREEIRAMAQVAACRGILEEPSSK